MPRSEVYTAGHPGAVVNPPVWRASTHLYPDSKSLHAGKPNEDGHFYYGRRGSPTQWALSDALTALEPGAAGTVLYPSGVAALAGGAADADAGAACVILEQFLRSLP